jgi:molybdopterin-guanine dinucleotide biosynthesis protein A
MGTDKALIEIDGQAMAARVAAALRTAGADTVATVGGDVAQLRRLGLDARPDRWPGEGPLGGVIESLRAVGRRPVVVVLSCDLVEPDPVVVETLVDRLVPDPIDGVDVVVPVAGGRPQWTHAAWRRSCLNTLQDRFAAGERSLVGAATGLRVDRWDVHDPAAFADADVPTDLPSRRGHP